MDMYKELQKTIASVYEGLKPVEYYVGTVKSVNPVTINLGDGKMIRDTGSNIVYTESVLEKKISITHSHNTDCLSHTHDATGLSHTHRINSNISDTSLSDSYTTTQDLDGSYESLPALDELLTITEGMQIGDTLLMLRVSKGQKFIVLSKLRKEKSVTIDKNNNWNWS